MVSAATKQVIDRAKQIYADQLQSRLEAEHRDQFVAIEPESGDYFLGDSSTRQSNWPARSTLLV
jgi:hypothetical protein